MSALQKEEESAPGGRVKEEKKAVLERSSFCDRVVTDPQEKPSEEPLGDQRTVTDKRSPPLELLDDSDSHLESQKP